MIDRGIVLGVPGLAAALVVAAIILLHTQARADETTLALAQLGGAEEPGLLLAQRAIDRAWGQSEDSTYVVVDVPQWRSEGLAAGLSGAVPGVGEAYAGAPRTGVWFALAEVAGWTTRWLYMRRGHQLEHDAAAYAGAPGDSTSRWSFARWEAATQGDPSELEALYAGDRDGFYDRIAHDPAELAGWAGDATATRAPYTALRDVAADRLRVGRYAGAGLWINHLVSAIDALRLARLHDLPLRRNLSLHLRGGWQQRGLAWSASLKRSF